MTVVVAFHCTDGAVIAADSMITPSVGGIGVGHHTGRKLYVLPHNHILGWSGDQGLAMRFRAFVDLQAPNAAAHGHPLDHGLNLSQLFTNSCVQTNAGPTNQVSAVLAYVQGGQPQCCTFEGNMQPRLLDVDHYYCAHGSGKLSADPFLRFLVDIFCAGGRPSVHTATWLAAWTVQHVIDTTQGGVAPPIRIGVLESVNGALAVREVPDDDIKTHLRAVQSGEQALRDWRDKIQAGAVNAPPVPQPAPAAPAQAAPAAGAPVPNPAV